MYRLIWSIIGLYLAYKLIRFLISPKEAQEPKGNKDKNTQYNFRKSESTDNAKTYTKDFGEEIEYEEIESKHRS